MHTKGLSKTIDSSDDIVSVTPRYLLKLLGLITMIELDKIEHEHWEKYLIRMGTNVSIM